MKFSFTLAGGLGDYILRYLGSPGNRLAHITQLCPGEVHLRVSAKQTAGHDLIRGNPFFSKAETIQETVYVRPQLPNDIQNINGLEQYYKLVPPLWLDAQEDDYLRSMPRPYAVFHPYASGQHRNLNCVIDIQRLAQWTADASGLHLYVLGHEDFGYESRNVKQIKGSTRLAVKAVEGATFFVGTHSSMQCAAWVHDIPSLCIGPSHLMFHDLYAPASFDTYLKPLFRKNNLFLMYEQAELYPRFFDHFLRTATALTPQRTPQECRQRLSLLSRALDTVPTLGINSC